jgi:hypothetical protein
MRATANVRLSVADPLCSSEPISGGRKDAKECWHRPPICIERPRTTRGIACRGATAEA